MFGAFVPYQVVIYPLIIGLSSVGLFATLPGIIIVHTIFGMPILTLLFRNFYAAMPVELFKAARVDGAGLLAYLFSIMLPMSVPITVVAIILQVTGIWNDFLFGIVFAGRSNWPMTVQLNNIVNTTTGRSGVQCQHGGHHPDGRRAAGHLFRLRQDGSCAASPPAR